MNILIIEDELNAARELERIIHTLDSTASVVAILDTVESSIPFLSQHRPDLIFSDIQLADGMCFDIYRVIKVESPIIFCTAYDDYMLEAFDTNAVSYLLKPITEEIVAKALDKFRALKRIFEPEAAAVSIENLARQLKYNYKTSLLVEHRGRIIPLQATDIAYIYLENTATKIITTQNQKYFFPSNLDELERILDPEMFYRANRQFIINRLSVTTIEKSFSRKLVIKLKGAVDEPIVVSKAKASEFIKWLGK